MPSIAPGLLHAKFMAEVCDTTNADVMATQLRHFANMSASLNCGVIRAVCLMDDHVVDLLSTS
eukprot:m.34067 g.34067  ORF g.34067 m.34067 type:complete len:63 (-) comp5096_c0_seq2:77-265(-)